MEHYTDLAFRYIKMNKRRSILTVMGVSISVMFLYMLLNLGLSYLLNYRAYLRDNFDYEIVLFPNDKQQIQDILNDVRVKDGVIDDYYKYDYYSPETYKNALYINTTNPYRMDKIFKELKEKYGVDGKLHIEMAATYLQGDNGSFAYVMILIALLISYIIAIFGVGLVRSSIQLNMLERIKDFGQLRCIGSTRRQVKGIIYLQGLILELTGIVCGTLLGVLGSLIAGAVVGWEHTGFHALPLAFIMIAFTGDLYFAMDENAKLVADMTPVSAIRGEYRIRKERLKRRRSRLFGRLFGMKGDYAYKNIKRNPGRFYRIISAMTLGVAAAIIIFGVLSTLAAIKTYMDQDNGYYHVYYEHTFMPWESESELMNSLPEFDMMEQVSEMPGLAKASRIYTAAVATSDKEKNVLDHYLDEYVEKSNGGTATMVKQEGNEDYYEEFNMTQSLVALCGYDEEDMTRYEDSLIDGRLPEKDNEIMMVVSNYLYLYDAHSDKAYETFMRYLDFQVGDTIDIVNPIRLRSMILELTAPVTEEYEKESKRLEDEKEKAGKNNDEEAYNALKNKIDRLDADYRSEQIKIRGRCYKQLVDEKDYTTYSICGILKGDVNQGKRISADMSWTTEVFYEPLIAIVPKEQYMNMLGVDESAVSGMQYHFDRLNVNRYYDIDNEAKALDESGTGAFREEATFLRSGYPAWVNFWRDAKRTLFGIGLVVLFIVVMSVINTINATSSSMYMRRKELAQLRVLGAAKGDVFRIVMLEGVIESIIACVLGVFLGTGLSLGVFYGVFVYFEAVRYSFPWLATVLSVVVTVLILCGAVYFPLKRLPNDVAAELMTAGE